MKSRLVPPGWRRVQIAEIARERSERGSTDRQSEVFSVTKYDGFVRSLDYFDRQVFSRDTSNYKLVRRNDLAYATIHLDEGSLGLLTTADQGLVSPMYTVFEAKSSEVEPRYLYRLMKQPWMIGQYGRIGEGTAHRRRSISFERLGRLAITIPPRSEQEHILTVLVLQP